MNEQQATENKRTQSLRELAELMAKPDVAQFLVKSVEVGMPTDTTMARKEGACNNCCLLFAGGGKTM